MKKLSILFTLLALCAVTLFAQAPEKFSYQVVVRNASNQLVTNAPVGVRVSVLQGTATGNPVYVETHTASTNANGLLTLEIGGGNVQQGIFANIDWANGPFFLTTETDPNGGSNYSVTSTQQLLSVPYAIYSKEAGNGFSGDYNDLTNKPELFSGDYNALTNLPTIPTVPANVSAFVNDAGYLTGYTETDPQFNAWDKDYNDLINTPTIPTVPTNVSVFSNDAGYITAAEIPAQVNADWNATNGPAQILNKPAIPTVPTNVSVFNNDAGYITMEQVPEQPQGTTVGDLLYWNGTAWVVVPAGQQGQQLVMDNGTPTWQTPADNSLHYILFNANGGNGSMNAQFFPGNVAQTVSNNTFVRSGFMFTGWNTAADGTGTAYAPNAVLTLTQNITLYAQWTTRVRVNLPDPCGQSGTSGE